MENTNKNNKMIYEFLLLLLLIPLVCIGIQKLIPTLSNGFGGLLLFGIQAMSPAFAAAITVLYNNSQKRLVAFLKNRYIENISFKICFIAFCVPMILLIIAKLAAILFHTNNFIFDMPSPAKFLIICWALIAEELGWRGFLQERIERKVGMTLTPFVVGAIWGLWHFHYYIIGGMNTPFILLILGCIFESYGYYVITKIAKGNILPASIWHFSGNLFINLLMLNTNMLSYLCLTITYGFCIVGFVIYKYMCSNLQGSVKP